MAGPRIVTLPRGGVWPVAELRRLIREATPAAPEQPALFELRIDARPAGERTASERYASPNLFTRLELEQ